MKNLSLYFAKVISTLSTFFFNIYLAKIADIEYFGVFSLLLNFTFLFNLISDWGFSTYGPAELSKLKVKSNLDLYLSNVFTFKLILCLLAAILYTILILSFYGDHLHFLSFGIFLILLNFLNVDWVARGLGRYNISSIRQISNALLNVICIVAIWAFKLSVLWVYTTYTASIIASYLLSILLLRRHEINIRLRFSGILSELKNTFLDTKFAFLGVLLFNVIYSLNLPLLTLFNNKYEGSLYASYYTIFSSLSAIVLITQDLFFPKFNAERKEEFIKKYSLMLMTGTLIMILVVLTMPLYYNLLYPATFKLEPSFILILTLFCISFSLRLLFANSLMLTKDYKSFYKMNLIGIITYALFVVLLVSTGNFNTKTAFLSIVATEIIILCLSQQKLLISIKSVPKLMPFAVGIALIVFLNSFSFYSLYFNVLLLLVCVTVFIKSIYRSITFR